MKNADLHIHTTASDGRRTPSEVVRIASEIGLAAVSITDHDTVAGVDEALKAGRELDIEVIPGVEISTVTERGIEVHVLGYFIDPANDRLSEQLRILQDARAQRGREMVERLSAAGMPISFERVREIAGGGAIGRPHVARALWESGFVSSMDAAFGKYLQEGCPGYVPRFKISPQEAVELILAAGGIASCGHVAKIKCDDLLLDLARCGMAAIEVYHPDHGKAATRFYERFAEKHGLIATGGSDAHGIGGGKDTPIGSVTVPYSIVERLREAAKHP